MVFSQFNNDVINNYEYLFVKYKNLQGLIMKIKQLFPKFNLPIVFRELKEDHGQYWFKSDCIVLDSELKRSLPGCAKIVFLHEMIHSTLPSKRLMRMDRLVNKFGAYTKDSLSYRLEECIAEVGCMIAAMKLGLFNEYSKNVIVHGLEKHYTSDMYIPIREVRAAVKYYANDDVSFEEEIEATKLYLEAYMDIKFQDSYEKKETA